MSERAQTQTAGRENLSALDGWGLYIHVPFCARKCPYCDFTVAVLRDRPEVPYVDALIVELDARRKQMSGPLRTIYVGGGTPGLLVPASVDRLGAQLRQRGLLDGLEEFTVEVNPEQADEERLAAWKRNGATRISMGAQALHPNALKILGREHEPHDVFDAIARAESAGFDHISIDFIFAVPGVKPARTLEDMQRAMTIPQIDHVSLYELTVEPQTVFGVLREKGELPPWPDDDVLEHWHALGTILASGGFERYEVSNFARKGGRAVHNASYWFGRPYLGIGVSAASFTWQTSDSSPRPTHIQRRTNRAQLRGYLKDPLGGATSEDLSWKEHLGELLSLGMRTQRGVNLPDLERRFGLPLPHVEERLAMWSTQGRAHRRGRGFESNEGGMEIADTIGVDLLHALDRDLSAFE